MNAAMSEVNDLFRMPERPRSIDRRTAMPGICRGRRVSVEDGGTELLVVDQPGESAIPDSLQLSIPTRGRQPDLKLDVRIRRRLGLSNNAAKGRQRFIKSAQVNSGKDGGRSDELSSFDCFCRRDRYSRNVHRHHFFA